MRVAHLYKKLQVQSKSEAVAKAMRERLFEWIFTHQSIAVTKNDRFELRRLVALSNRSKDCDSIKSKTATNCRIPITRISTRMGGDGDPLSRVSSASGQRSEG
jgi:hypothetical protein